MTLDEFSHGFDVLVDSYRRMPRFDSMEPSDTMEFNEYEKSVYLSMAQETLMLAYYSGRNAANDSFERTEEVRRYMSSLVKAWRTSEQVEVSDPATSMSVFYALPPDLWFITYEAATFDDESLGCLDGKTVRVVPVTQDTLSMVLENPYRGPGKRRVLRLDRAGNIVELVSNYSLGGYLAMYIARPTPIILIDLPDGLSIDGISTKTPCHLEKSMHRAILTNAVAIAMSSRVAGKTSEK